MIEWKLDFYWNRCMSVLLIVISRRSFLCFHFWFHLQNVRWKFLCFEKSRWCWQIWKTFFLIIRQFLSVLKRRIKIKFRSESDLNNCVRHRKNLQTWNQNHSSKNKCLIEWRNWFELKIFLIFHDRVWSIARLMIRCSKHLMIWWFQNHFDR